MRTDLKFKYLNIYDGLCMIDEVPSDESILRNEIFSAEV